MNRLTRSAALVAVLAFVFGYSGHAAAQNVLFNAGFDISGGGPTTFTGMYYGGASAASGWTVWNGRMGTTATELLPTTDTLGPTGGDMIHVTASGDYSGLVQTHFLGGPFTSLDVYVLSGSVFWTNTGPGGYYSGKGAVDSTPNRWQHLTFDNAVTDEVILYSKGGPAEWYADAAYVGPTSPIHAEGAITPEPGALVLATALLPLGLVLVRRYRS